MNILYVEDDPGLGHLLAKHLRSQNHTVRVVGSVAEATRSLGNELPDVMVCDHHLPDGNGLDLMKSALAAHSDLPCIMLTGVGSEALAVAAMKAGARDYVVKDIENNFLTLVPTIIERIGKERALQHELAVAEREKSRLEARNRYLSTSLKEQASTNIPIGQHPAFTQALNVIGQVAPTDATVMITGETGTGKEMAAQMIHDMSARADKPFITLNCAALPAQLVESELFGHEKGAFTGAIKTRAGRFEAADGGTLFLDEIGELSIELQPRLLRALQESKFERVGSSETQTVDVRIISATNQDLPAMIFDRTFREDLYYRLNVIPVHIPPLRERESDIELLFMHFVKQVSNRHGIEAPDTTASILQSIHDYAWPGNIRELRNYVERSVVTQMWNALPTVPAAKEPDIVSATYRSSALTLDELDRNHIIEVLQNTNGVIAGDGGAAQILGVNANTLRSRMKRLGIKKPGFSL